MFSGAKAPSSSKLCSVDDSNLHQPARLQCLILNHIRRRNTSRDAVLQDSSFMEKDCWPKLGACGQLHLRLPLTMRSHDAVVLHRRRSQSTFIWAMVVRASFSASRLRICPLALWHVFRLRRADLPISRSHCLYFSFPGRLSNHS